MPKKHYRPKKKSRVIIKNGDPILPPIILGGVDYGSVSYLIRIDSAGAGIDGRWHTILKWTYPITFVDGKTLVPGGGNYGTHWPVFSLSLQRSPTDESMPRGEDTPISISMGVEPKRTLTEPDWSTVQTWGPTSVDLLPTTYTDGVIPNPDLHYRLIMQMGPFRIGSGGVAEVDWNVCTVSLH